MTRKENRLKNVEAPTTTLTTVVATLILVVLNTLTLVEPTSLTHVAHSKDHNGPEDVRMKLATTVAKLATGKLNVI